MTTATERARGTLNRHGSGRARRALAVLTVVATTAAWIEACVVPVFRYALERWEPRPYHLRLRGADLELARLDEAAVQAAVHEAGTPANLAFMPTASAPTNPAADDPTLDLYLPGAIERGAAPFWSAPASAPALAAVLDSPTRTELVDRLTAGDNAVFLLLECGDAERDRAVASLLDRELPRLASTLEIGDADPIDPAAMQWPETAPDLDVRFSWLRLSRGDPRESVLAANLLATEPDLARRAGDPIVFPVFGRGFVPYALAGAGVNARTIRAACDLAIAPCSCVLKREVRGIHLLLTAAWDDRIGPSYIDVPGDVPLVGVAAPADDDAGASGAAPPPPAMTTTDEDVPGPRFGPMHAVAVVLGVAALAAGVWTALRERRRDGSEDDSR